MVDKAEVVGHDIETIMSIRAVKRLITAKPTLEGAGVHLRRAFGFGQTSDYDYRSGGRRQRSSHRRALARSHSSVFSSR
jgi:hypothetical protein